MSRVIILVLACACALARGRQIKVTNKDGGDIWVGCKGNEGKAHLGFGGFVLSSGETRTLDAADDWSGHFWARTWCDTNNNHCLTGDCGNKISCSSADFTPPVTAVELTFGDTDYYDISLVHGFNILAEISPVGGTGDCSKASCQSRIANDCPDELKVDTEHGVLACKSTCVAFDTDEYCCRGNYASADSCKADDWDDYGTFFSSRCPDAILTPYDTDAVHSCKADTYEIKFGG